jgi:hypothetical protein
LSQAEHGIQLGWMGVALGGVNKLGKIDNY